MKRTTFINLGPVLFLGLAWGTSAQAQAPYSGGPAYGSAGFQYVPQAPVSAAPRVYTYPRAAQWRGWSYGYPGWRRVRGGYWLPNNSPWNAGYYRHYGYWPARRETKNRKPWLGHN